MSLGAAIVWASSLVLTVTIICATVLAYNRPVK